jgi:hypothetical protein
MNQSDLYRRVTEQHFPDYLFLVGLSETAAAATLKEKGKRLHVAKRDGQDQMTTKEIDPNRINVVVVTGKIIGVDSID